MRLRKFVVFLQKIYLAIYISQPECGSANLTLCNCILALKSLIVFITHWHTMLLSVPNHARKYRYHIDVGGYCSLSKFSSWFRLRIQTAYWVNGILLYVSVVSISIKSKYQKWRFAHNGYWILFVIPEVFVFQISVVVKLSQEVWQITMFCFDRITSNLWY